MSARNKVRDYYKRFDGHEIEHLEIVYDTLRGPQNDRPLMFLCGDSTMDNKHWFPDKARACNGLEQCLQPAMCKKDVEYWLNREAVDRGLNLGAINTAVEASTLQNRAFGLLEQDEFVRSRVRPTDTICISIGGNDIALAPMPCTILSILQLSCCVPQWCIENFSCVPCVLPCDDQCVGCTTGVVSCCFAAPSGLGYLVHMFKTRVEHYARRLTSITKPRRILVCMVYCTCFDLFIFVSPFPSSFDFIFFCSDLDQDPEAVSWASRTLSILGYDRNPGKLQSIIRRIFELATSQIRIEGTEVVAVPLFAALDGTDTNDYASRVEPSPQGGHKLANLLLDAAHSCDGDDACEQVDGAVAMKAAWDRIQQQH
jgi:hypothetical protein